MKEITIWKWLIAIIVILALFLYVPVYIAGPDCLETVFQAYGFTPLYHIWNGLIPEYQIPWIANEWITSFLSGILGIFIVFAIMYGLGKLIVRKK